MVDKVAVLFVIVAVVALAVAAHQIWVAGKRAQSGLSARQQIRQRNQAEPRRRAAGDKPL